jgi:hypothetical protein
MHFKTGFVILFLFVITLCNAQELQCNVTVDASQIPDVQASIITDMKQTITRFLNERRWTNDVYTAEERIRCNLAITITSQPEQYKYNATAQIQVSRPVYGTAYETVLLNYLDKNFNFELNVGQPIDYNENIYNSAISSLLSYYAYIILALDYDSFSKLGGQPYIEKAWNITNVAASSGGGWVAGSDPNNRFGLIENLNSQQMLPFREQFYIYHRSALDTYLKDPDASRLNILNMLKVIKTINQIKPYAILLRTFFLSKRDELINIFKDSESMETKSSALALLRELDPLNSEKYQMIIK